MKKSQHLKANIKYYDNFAARFREKNLLELDKAAKYEFNKIKEKLDLRKKRKIIELGCGIGRYSLALSKCGHDVTATDISQESLNILNSQVKNHKIKNLKAVRKDFSSVVYRNKYDIGICISTYHVLGDNEQSRIKIISNFIKSIKHGGTILLVEPNPINPLFYFFYLFYPCVQRSSIKSFLTSSPYRLKKMLEDECMEEIKISYVGFLPLRFIGKYPFVINLNETINRIPFLNMISAFSYITAIKK